MDGRDTPGIETISSVGGPRGNPLLPCHECGTETRFMTMKRDDDWTMKYLDDGSGHWVAYCPECLPDRITDQQEDDTDA